MFFFPFFNAYILTVPIVDNMVLLLDIILKQYSVMFSDSTISCPTHGIALIRLVITVAKSLIRSLKLYAL